MAAEILNRLNIANFDTKLERKDLKLLKAAFGATGLHFFAENIRNGIVNTDSNLKSVIDNEFFRNLSNEFGTFTTEQYVSALKEANEIHQYVVERLGLPEWEVGVLNEVASFSDSPFDRLAMFSRQDAPLLLRYQLGEQLLLALISASIDSRTKGKKLRTQLDNLVKLTDKNLFGNRIGVTQEVNVYSTHDYANRVVDIHVSPFNNLGNGVIQKKTSLRVRNTQIGGKNMQLVCDIRKKDDKVATLKALEKAIHNGHKRIDLKDVTDMTGIKLVVVKGNVKEIINYFEGMITKEYPDSEIEKDDATQEERGQSNRHRFMRRQFHINENKFEVVFYTLRDFLNSQYDIGSVDDNDVYNGAAHSLYELKRISHIATHLFPEDIYGLKIDNYQKLAQERIVQQLRQMNNYIE